MCLNSDIGPDTVLCTMIESIIKFSNGHAITAINNDNKKWCFRVK